MAEYIDREALLNSICKKYCDCDYDGECPNCRLTETIATAPAADVAPVRHGRWEWDTEDFYRCTVCYEKAHVKEVMGRPDWDYCPNCGARMDGAE